MLLLLNGIVHEEDLLVRERGPASFCATHNATWHRRTGDEQPGEGDS
jgi:hypothetical protein